MRNVLGFLLTAVAALGLHSPLCYAGETVVSWELHAFADVDGVRKLDKKVLLTPFNDLLGCVKYALTLPQPKEAEQIAGHTIVYGYTCVRIEAPGVTT